MTSNLPLNAHQLTSAIPVAAVRCTLEHETIVATWDKLFAKAPQEGRMQYALYWDKKTYFACTTTLPEDTPDAWGWERMEIPAGWYVKYTLVGPMDEITKKIDGTLESMQSQANVEQSRPWVEEYVDQDKLALWVPVGATEAAKYA